MKMYLLRNICFNCLRYRFGTLGNKLPFVLLAATATG